MDDEKRLQEERLLRLLGKGGARCRPAAATGKVLVAGRDDATIGIDLDVLRGAVSKGLVVRESDAIALSLEGRAAGDRARGGDGFRFQHQDLGTRRLEVDGCWQTVTVDHKESPLAALMRRRGHDGEPFLSEAEFRAGERLRSDYTRGGIIARTGMNWDFSGGGTSSHADRNRRAELTDAAVAARGRIDEAIHAVGPELAGVMLDVCCFLKGLEQVEAERGWPRRSAKIMLKTSLGALARHYEPRSSSSRSSGQGILHWGGEGYRPSLS